MEIILIALAPVAIIATYVWYRDKYDREPVGMVMAALLAGAIIVIPVLFTGSFFSFFGQNFKGLLSVAYNAFIVAALIEEFFKYTALCLLIWRSPHFNDKYDGIVYATFISLGFAGVENILYVAQGGFSTGMLRAFTAVPAHAIFGITMGFYFGLARFYPASQKILKQKALWIPILLHGIYDFILMTGIEWLWTVFAGFVIYLYFSGFKKMKNLSDQSFFRTDYDLLNRKFEKET